MSYDEHCRRVCDDNPNMLVPWYLMASYAYYCLDEALLTDAAFDHLCRRLALRWRSVKHRHKGLIERGENPEKVGSCFMLADDYPGIVRGAAHQLLIEARKPPASPEPEPVILQRRARKELPRSGFFV